MDVPLWLWFAVLGTILAMLVVDLVAHRRAHIIGVREALAWSAVWIALGVAFGVYLWNAFGAEIGQQYFAGYLIEKSLAVDNIFVFVVVFNFFGVPPKYQHRVLFFGILGALVFRILFITLGAALMQFHWVVILFGVFLILTGIKILIAGDKPLEPEKNPVIKLARKYLRVTPQLVGQRFFVREGGLWQATPLFVALIFIEVSDIIFAVDSVPAIFAITKEPFIVFTSNVFAILGLRAMYFMLAGVVHKFVYLKYGLGLVLIFVGLKMVWLNHHFDGKFPIGWSLGIIAGIIAVSITLSLLRKTPPPPVV